MVHDGDQNKIGGDSGEACITFCAGNMCPNEHVSCTTNTNCNAGDVCVGGCCIANTPGTDAGTPPPGSDAGNCPAGWQIYMPSGGGSICTPPPTNGQCPDGYVITIQNGQQFCTPVQIN
jgi:hypothetical protein